MKLPTTLNVRMPALIAGIAILAIVGFGVLGYRLYELQADVLVEQGLDDLTALGASQVAQMDEWVSERKNDVAVVSSTPTVADFLVATANGAVAPAATIGLIDRIATTFDYDAVVLADSRGFIRLVRPSLNASLIEGSALPPGVSRGLVEAQRTGIPAFVVSTEVSPNMGPNERHLVYFAAPVSDGHGRLLGGVVFIVDPARAEFPRVLALKRVGTGVSVAIESLVVHDSGSSTMVVAGDPRGLEKHVFSEEEAPTLGVVSRAARGIAWRAREQDRSGRAWLAAGVWSPTMGMGFVNRQPEDLVTVSIRRNTILGVTIASLVVVALAALAVALWRGSRLKALAALRVVEGEKASLEKRLAEAERLEVVGRLAGGVAHDFNNLLAVVIGHLELADSSTDAGERLKGLRVARDAAARAARIGRQLLGVGRQQVLERAPLDLRPHVARAAEALRGITPPGVEIEVRGSETLALVHADAVEIERVILNLMMNAVEAAGESGRVVLAAMDRTVAESVVAVNGEVAPGRYVVLRVEDDGPGIAQESRAKVFEPFFTTKRDGRGGGLGLASALGIVSQHGGFLILSSEPGEGAVFEVYLPALDGGSVPVEFDSGLGSAPLALEQGACTPETAVEATILVVDDEAGVRTFVARALRSRGYRVVSASSAAEAEAVWRESGPVDLLVSDVIMPGGTGVELLASLRRLQPSLSAVLMSGYTAGVALGHDERPSGTRFLAKPFSVEELAGEAARALEGRLWHDAPGEALEVV
ncbi:MAG: ATP-binding protein [Thermoleophilia bacterium]